MRGVSSEGFSTTVHPAARAGATFLVTMLMGKFQGVIAATTPIGCFRTTIRLPLSIVSMMSPVVRLRGEERREEMRRERRMDEGNEEEGVRVSPAFLSKPFHAGSSRGHFCL